MKITINLDPKLLGFQCRDLAKYGGPRGSKVYTMPNLVFVYANPAAKD